MEQFSNKIRLIFLPFLYIALSVVIGYTFLHWLLLIKLNAFQVDEDIVNFIAPFIIPWIPNLIWLRPRIKLLKLNVSGRKDPVMAYLLLAWIAMAIPAIISQEYVVTATGKLTALDHISQIDKLPPTKYYTVKHYFISKRLVRAKTEFIVSGKHNEDLDMVIYAPCPIFDHKHAGDSVKFLGTGHEGDSSKLKKALIVLNGRVIPLDEMTRIDPHKIIHITVLKGNAAMPIYGEDAKYGAVIIQAKDDDALPVDVAPPDAIEVDTPAAWLAVKYDKTISNNASNAEKDAAYKNFAAQSQADFNAKDLNRFQYLDKMNYSKNLRGFLAAVRSHARGFESNNIIILLPVNEPFEARNGNKPNWILGTFAIGSIAFLITLLFAPLRTDAVDIDLKEQQTKERENTLLWAKGLFSYKSGLKATRLLIGLNLLIFIIMVCSGLGFISFSGEELLKWGANYRPLVAEGQYWRLFTCMFLHGGLMHVLFNMYGLFFVGIFLEPLIGSKKYIFAYIITGLLSSLASVWWHPATVSVGASGAIFGMYGVFFALLTLNFFPAQSKRVFLINTGVFIIYNLLYGLAGGIDNAAHIGGLLSGLLLGYAMYPFLKDKVLRQHGGDTTQQIVDELTNKTKSD